MMKIEELREYLVKLAHQREVWLCKQSSFYLQYADGGVTTAQIRMIRDIVDVIDGKAVPRMKLE